MMMTFYYQIPKKDLQNSLHNVCTKVYTKVYTMVFFYTKGFFTVKFDLTFGFSSIFIRQ